MADKVPSIIFEDDNLLVVNKPAGLAVHADGRTNEATLVDWVVENRPTIVGVGESMRLQNGTTIDRPGIVHRIDRETSGALLVAKDQDTFHFIKEQFQKRKVEKLYHAFVWGTPKSVHGTVDMPIGRSRKDFRLWSAGKDAGGVLRPAVTRYSVLGTHDGFSYLALEPKTGRTHQIRVHMKALGHPVVGDVRYAPKKPPALGFERLALHAFCITFTHPHGSRCMVEAPLPDDFIHAESIFGT
jgi:23S rRNA pseudouridine1911/1915/1917 synthase